MILKIEFENFFSIRDRVRIDFRAASINTAQARELSHNVMEWKGVPVLKTVGLFALMLQASQISSKPSLSVVE